MNVPFGLHFAEAPHVEAGLEATKPIYDYDAGLSYVTDSNGDRQPYVLWAWTFAGDTRTGTTTKAQGDSEDTDEDRNPRTHTMTATREISDSDY